MILHWIICNITFYFQFEIFSWSLKLKSQSLSQTRNYERSIRVCSTIWKMDDLIISVHSLIKIYKTLKIHLNIIILVFLIAMTLPFATKLGMFSLVCTTGVLIATLLFLIIEHNQQIERLQTTISHICIVALRNADGDAEDNLHQHD